MKVSTRAEYGIRALIDLAQHYGEGPVQSHDIATRQGIPESYLNQLLILLRRAGLIRSLRGPQGGHQLAQPPRAISIADIVTALDGPTASEGANPPSEARGNDAATDLVVRATWEQVNAAITDALSRITLDMLIQERQRHDTAAMFQMPVMIRTPNAGQATRLNRRAAARGMSAPSRRSTGTRAASVI